MIKITFMEGCGLASTFSSVFLLVCSVLSCCSASSISTALENNFLECLSYSNVQAYTPDSAPYTWILQSSVQNLRFASPTTPKPQFIVTPSHESQVPAIVVCSRKHGLQIRVRSGGHDFEGLSYTSHVPFVMIDLVNLRTINVDIENNSAWVQAGATLGEVYYRIAEKSPIHGFPAGFSSTVGVGGHISGGGCGAMTRMHGMAADHVIDARLVNAEGEILDRETMGEGLFWAIRGGGAASFGVVLAFKIKLVQVPPVVTASKVNMTLEQGALEIIHKWQSTASYEVPKELFIQVFIYPMTTNNNSTATIEGFGRILQVEFQMMFLGPKEELVHLMQDKFPELGIKQKHCKEMSWIESAIFFGAFPNGAPLEVLLDRTLPNKDAFKTKSDFVTKPMSKVELKQIFNKSLEEEKLKVVLSPWGGRMSEILEDEIAFPHRGHNLYMIEYSVVWDEDEERTKASQKYISWIRELYLYMSPYVSKSPRAAYFNTRDLDLGQNKINSTPTYCEARIWGEKYFKGNFEKLVKVKSEVDPDNFFSNEQSIPPMTPQSMESTY